jgi:hypothetical protein
MIENSGGGFTFAWKRMLRLLPFKWQGVPEMREARATVEASGAQTPTLIRKIRSFIHQGTIPVLPDD